MGSRFYKFALGWACCIGLTWVTASIVPRPSLRKTWLITGGYASKTKNNTGSLLSSGCLLHSPEQRAYGVTVRQIRGNGPSEHHNRRGG